MTDDMRRLLDRLQTGWSPHASEIDREIAQRDLIDWEFYRNTMLIGEKIGGGLIVLGEILWIDRWLDWAVTPDALVWLYTAEEGAKMRYLGG